MLQSCETVRPVATDSVRSFAPAFIFTTASPPAVAGAALASIRHLKGGCAERRQLEERVARVRRGLDAAGIPHPPTPTHIVPVMAGEPVPCKEISDHLADRVGIYVRPINYPTAPRGAERLRITPSPLHSDADIDHLIGALPVVWTELDLERARPASDDIGRAAAAARPTRAPSRTTVRAGAE